MTDTDRDATGKAILAACCRMLDRDLAARHRARRVLFVGPPPKWIDRAIAWLESSTGEETSEDVARARASWHSDDDGDRS